MWFVPRLMTACPAGSSPLDAAILEAARTSGCSVVLSEDLGDGQDYDGLTVENPFAGPTRPLIAYGRWRGAQTLVQLTDELLELLDERAARERRSRSTLIREAIEDYLSDDLQAEIDRRIVDGYQRVPQTDDEDAWAEANARAAIREEPW